LLHVFFYLQNQQLRAAEVKPPRNQAVLSGSEVVTLPSGLEEILPWKPFNITEAAPGGDLETAYEK
jgi:hypothetical protein